MKNPLLPHTTKGIYRFSVGAFFFIQGLVFASWASRIPDIKRLLNLNDAALGGVLFSIPVGQMTAMALSGYLVSRFGSRRMLITGALIYSGTLVLMGAAPSAWTLSAGLFLFGMAANLCNIAVNTQGVGVERLYSHSIMASFHGLWSLAGFIGGLISTWVVGYGMSPFFHFCLIFLASSIILVSMRNSILPRDNSSTENHNKAESKQKKIFVRPDRHIILLGLIAAGCMACEGTMFDWSGVYFQKVVEAPESLIRLGYIAFMCTMTCGRFLADKLVSRFGAIPVIRTSGYTMAGGLLLSVLFPNITAATIGFLFVGIGTSSVVPLCYSLAGRSKRMLPGVALATVSTVGFLGFLLGPPIIGFIAQALNLRWSFALIAMIGLMASLLAPGLREKE